MKEHNHDLSGNEYIIRVADNGYIFRFKHYETVFNTFTELINYLASCVGTRAIGEELKIVSNKDENNE